MQKVWVTEKKLTRMHLSQILPPQRLITVKDLYETTKLNLNAYLDKPDAQDFVKKYDKTYGVSLPWGIDDNYQDNYDSSDAFRRY